MFLSCPKLSNVALAIICYSVPIYHAMFTRRNGSEYANDAILMRRRKEPIVRVSGYSVSEQTATWRGQTTAGPRLGLSMGVPCPGWVCPWEGRAPAGFVDGRTVRTPAGFVHGSAVPRLGLSMGGPCLGWVYP